MTKHEIFKEFEKAHKLIRDAPYKAIHECKIHTIKDGKTVCVYCGKEMEI